MIKMRYVHVQKNGHSCAQLIDANLKKKKSDLANESPSPAHPTDSILKEKSSLLLYKPEMKVVRMKGWIIGTWGAWDILSFHLKPCLKPLVFKEVSVQIKKGRETASLKSLVPPKHQAEMESH